ncbi:CHAT domain-containing protein [Russula brevipes]|nr:CHAT domain-containing protein [Russula brevipes]
MPPEEQDTEHTVLPREVLNRQLHEGVVAAINKLPEELLAEIFCSCRSHAVAVSRGRPWEWHRLAHVCRTWRSIIFDSTRRLGLGLFCTNGTPVKDTLHCWPNLPIIMQYYPLAAGDEDNIVAALQHWGRIRKIQLAVTTPLAQKLANVTQDKFSSLEVLELTTPTETGLALRGQCLGGEASNLRILRTSRIAFPGLPQVLSSARNLVSLQLEAIPTSGYIPPEDLITHLSAMTGLQMFHLHFLSPTFPISNEFPPPLPTRVTLPSLKHFEFHGDSEYLESFLASINAPVKYFYITFFYDPDFRIPYLKEFICRTETQRLPVEATLCYSGTDISITFAQPGTPRCLGLRILCRHFGWQMSSMAAICTEFQAPEILSTVRQLDIYAFPPFPDGHDDMDPSLFLDLLHQFDQVESLRVVKEIGAHITHAIRGDRMLPRMRDLHMEEHDEFASMKSTLTTHRRSNRPITLHPWEPGNLHSSPPRTRPARTTVPSIHSSDPVLVLEEEVGSMCERFSPRPFAVQSLFQQAHFLLLSFMQSGNADDLEHSIEIAQDLLAMHPKQIRRIKLLRILAFSFAIRTHGSGNREKSASKFEEAFQDESATMSERLKIAWWWATFARRWDHPSTTLAYQNTLSVLQSALAGAFIVEQPASIDRLGWKMQMPFEYASYQIERGQLELAVETIEQGKALIWSEIYGVRTCVGRLRRVNLDLADRLATVSQRLVDVNRSISARRAAFFQWDEEHEYLEAADHIYKKQGQLLRERQDIIAAIKALSGFENFMEAAPFRALQHAASRGPIIIITHCSWRCDIIIVLHDSPPSLIPMTEGIYQIANAWASTLLNARRKYAVESELFQQELRSILKELHERVGQPVIDRLRELGIPEQSRIWWYPTSVFCSLPLHAMGPVPSTDGRDQYFSDIYICSYTTTLGALIAARIPAPPISHHGLTLLFVGRPTESPVRMRDMEVIRSIGVPTTRLVFGNATREVVLNCLQRHRLVHFACRGHREEGKPFDTALELDDGDRLTLLDIVCSRVPTAELAVLSVGRTAEQVDGKDVEGLSLAAAMQHYGFGSVVGTMWDLGDDGGEDLSLGFYREMLSGGAEDDTPVSERSAKALWYTVQRLREKRVTLQRWANWVHYGA